MSSQRPFITCHVLDTISGRPATGISVALELVSPPYISKSSWTAVTNSDGRVPAWQAPDKPLNEVVDTLKTSTSEDQDQMVWRLTFATEAYYGRGNTFYPEVELKFVTKREEEHYHVPLLLGPWSYTTYRGS